MNTQVRAPGGLIYLAQAIDLTDDGGELADDARLVVSRASEFLQLPVFSPRRAWDQSVLHPGMNSRPGIESLVRVNQDIAVNAQLLIAVFYLRVPSWGMPFEVLSRRERTDGPTLLVCDSHPDRWPMYLQWALSGNAAWVPVGPHWVDRTESVDRALNKLGLAGYAKEGNS